MSPFDRLQNLFHEAIALPSGIDRQKWVEARCQDDCAMAKEVMALLDAHHAMTVNPVIRPAPEPVVPTAQFGAYLAERLIGRGGMSAVYLARRADGQFEQNVALKIMAAHLAGPEFLRRFGTERQFLATLSHHNITRLIDGGISSAGDPFLITEYVQGQTIERYCDDHKLGLAQRLRIFLQVCEAVDYAHRNLIVHRDLKPGNILVNAEGTVKLLDFGTASLLEVEPNVTATRARMLTPRYASPEQLRGARVNVATDVFSLGVVLYELLCGAWPFGDPDSMVCELNRVIGDVPVKPPATAVTEAAAVCRSLSKEHLSSQLTGDLSVIVLKALEDHPPRRYESVRRFAEDVENFLAGRPVLARPQTLLYRTRRFVQRRWLAVAAATVFVLGLSVASVVALHQAHVARQETEKAREEARKSARVTAFLRGILTAGSQAGGRDVTVLQLLNAAEPGIEKSWQDDPLAEATLRSSLGATYVTLEERDRAKLQLEKALALFQSLGRHVDAADALLVLGINERGEFPKAAYYSRCLEELKLAGNDAPPALLFRAQVYRAVTLKDFQQVHEAEALLNDAIAKAGSGAAISPGLRSTAFEVRAEAVLEQGRFTEAESGFRQAIELDNHAFDAWVMLARAKSLQQDFTGAADLARRDSELTGNFGPEDKAEAKVWWARYRADAGETAEALAQIREVMPAVREYCQRGHLLALYEQAAARVLNRSGHFGEAMQCARNAMDFLRDDQMPEIHPLNAASLEDLGRALRGLKRYNEAISAFEQSLKIYGQLGPAYSQTADRVKVMLAQVSDSKSE